MLRPTMSRCHVLVWGRRVDFYYYQTVANANLDNIASNRYSPVSLVRRLAMALVLLHVYDAVASKVCSSGVIF
jgi:hypothetical protein